MCVFAGEQKLVCHGETEEKEGLSQGYRVVRTVRCEGARVRQRGALTVTGRAPASVLPHLEDFRST